MRLFGWLTVTRQAWSLMQFLKEHPGGEIVFSRANDGRQAKDAGQAVDPKAGDLDVWVSSCVGAIARSLSEAPLILEEEIRDNGELVWTPTTTGDLAELVEKPNPVEPMMALNWKVVLSLLLSGDAYLVESEDGKELWHVASPIVTIKNDKDNAGNPLGYEIKQGGKVTTLPPERVIHFKLPNPINPTYGLSPIKPIRSSVLINHFYEKFMLDFFERGAVPGGIISTDRPAVPDRAREKARAEWDAIHGGKERTHRVAFMAAGYTYKAITPPIKELAVEVLTKVTRERILAAFNLPPVLAGVYEYANYANSSQQVKLFWQTTALPMLRLLEATYNMTLAARRRTRDIRGNRLRLRFKTEIVLALQEDKLEEADRSTKLYQGGVATLNESRVIVGLPLTEEGDGFYSPPAGVMIGGNNSLALAAPANDLVDPGTRKAYNAFLRSAVKAERKLATAWIKYFDGQLTRLIDRVHTVTGNGASASALFAIVVLKDDGFLPPNLDGIFDIDAENAKLLKELGPIVFELVESNAKDSLSRFDIALEFDVASQPATDFVVGMQNKMKDVNTATWDKLKTILTDAETDGLTVNQLVDKFRETPQLFDKTRAMRVVRTEGTTIANGSSDLAWKQAGVKSKQWLSTIDGVVRDTHAAADSQEVGINDKFFVGGESADYPGDYNLSAAERINCRCTHIPVLEEE